MEREQTQTTETAAGDEAADAQAHADDVLLTLAQAAQLFAVSARTFRRYTETGTAPEPVVLGAGEGGGRTAQTHRWWRSEVIDARARLPRRSETDSEWRRRSPGERSRPAASPGDCG